MSPELVGGVGIALSPFVMLVVSAAKVAVPLWMAGREPLVALLAGEVLALAAKLSGLGEGVPWLAVVLGGLAAGLGGQVLHDKALNPLLGKRAR